MTVHRNLKTSIIFDTETTGLLKPEAQDIDAQPQIIEIAMIAIDEHLDVIDRFDTFIDPGKPLPPEIPRITGIDDDMVRGKGDFETHYPAIAEFFTGADRMIAHNLNYDMSMLANELIRIDRLVQFPWPRDHYCTIENSMIVEQRRLNLGSLHTYATGAPHDNAHRAMGDVEATLACYRWIQNGGLSKFAKVKGQITQ